jgi:hypothetical protein
MCSVAETLSYIVRTRLNGVVLGVSGVPEGSVLEKKYFALSPPF